MDADVIVVGSGFGGSVCALRAAQSGRRVVVLERGRRLGPAGYKDMLAGRTAIFDSRSRPGLIVRPAVRGLESIFGSAVGGGSHVYTAVTIRAPDEIFASGWPSGITAQTLEPAFARVRETIAPTPIAASPARTRLLESVAQKLGAAVVRLPLAVNWPASRTAVEQPAPPQGPRASLVARLRGGSVCAKRTLDKTYLAHAEALGAIVRPLHEVIGVAPTAGGYRVFFHHIQNARRCGGSLAAPCVVLAAGTLATVRLLFSCRARGQLPKVSPALGERFFTNGDLGGLLVGLDDSLVADAGPPATAWLDFWRDERLFLMEMGIVPGLPGPLGRALRWWGGGASRGRAAWTIGTMGFDETPGRLVQSWRDGMAYVRDERGPGRLYAPTMRRLHDLADALGAGLIAIPRAVLGRTQFTVHPLGGAAMADSPQRGVVDARGEVFGHAGLFVADGSVFPTPTGGAPSMTIAAVAEHIIAEMVNA